MTLAGRTFLHTPGPTNIPERVLRAMHRSAVDFAEPAFERTLHSCLLDLKQIFRTTGEIFLFSANGHGAWEVPLVNLFEPGDRLLVPLAGRFSKSWAEMVDRLGLDLMTTPINLRRAIDPDLVETVLRQDRDHRIKGVLTVHTETATGTRCDLAAVRRAIDAADHPALYVVDAIATLATERFEMDAWGIDVALSSSQKGLMLPPGMAMVAVNDKAMRMAEHCPTPRRYWDLQFRRGDMTYMIFHGTPPEQMVWGLREALDMLLEWGLDDVIARHARLADAVRAASVQWCRAGTMELQAERSEERSNAVTAIRVAEGLDADTMRVLARDRLNVALGAGLDDTEGRTFRIGHLGDLNEPMILGALASVELAMRLSGISFQAGGVEAAIASLAESAPG